MSDDDGVQWPEPYWLKVRREANKELAAKDAEIESLKAELAIARETIQASTVMLETQHEEHLDELERLTTERDEAREAARACWQMIYVHGDEVISDESCTWLSDNWPWLEEV